MLASLFSEFPQYSSYCEENENRKHETSSINFGIYFDTLALEEGTLVLMKRKGNAVINAIFVLSFFAVSFSTG